MKMATMHAGMALTLLAWTGSASALSLEVGGFGRFETLEPAGTDENFMGPTLGGFLTGSLINLREGTDIKFGVQAGWFYYSQDDDQRESKLSTTFVGPLAGLNVAVTDHFHLGTMFGYDFGFAGKVKTEQGGKSQEADLKNFGRIHYGVNALYYTVSNISFGTTLGWNQGAFRVEDSTEDADFRGFQFGIMLGVPILGDTRQ